MSVDVNQLITKHLDLWTSTIKNKATTGRGSSKKVELYGIDKLKSLIFDLAVQGKLVQQHHDDNQSSFIGFDFLSNKKKYAKEKKLISKYIPQDLKPLDNPKIPSGWALTKIGLLFDVYNGNSVSKSEKAAKFEGVDGIPYVATKDVGYGFQTLDYENGVKIPESEKQFKIAPESSVLICSEGGSAGKKCGLVTTDICFGNKLFCSKMLVETNQSFTLIYYLSTEFKRHFLEKMTGIIGGISLKNFSEIPLPLPPLTEQHRIVAKVDELMALCDALETQTEESLQAHQLLVETLLKTLTKSQNAVELTQNWNRIAEHFDTLFTTEQSIDTLQETILQLAVMGKLVPQDSSNEPASVLLKKITAEKERLVKEKKLKKAQIIADSVTNLNITQFPKSWATTKCSELLFVTKLAGFEYSKHFNLKDSGEVPVVRAQNVKKLKLKEDSLKYIDLKTSILLDRCALYKRSLLVTFIGAGIGDVALFDKDERWHLAPNVAKMELFEDCDSFINLKYLNYFLVSRLGRDEIFKHLKATAQPSISMGTIRDIDFPIPPLLEQNDIVAKVDQLKQICTSLRQSITGKKVVLEKLTDSLTVGSHNA